jgi:hemerythrin
MDPKLILGHHKIDSDHKKLFELIDQLASAMKTSKSKQAGVVACSELLDYTRTHFSMEETLMRQQGYPQITTHLAAHDVFVNRIVESRKKFDTGSAVASVELLTFLLDWLRTHIQRTDKLLVGALR